MADNEADLRAAMLRAIANELDALIDHEKGAPTQEDLRAALHAAVEAGVIEGWQYAFPREHVDEWRISLTSEQARVLFRRVRVMWGMSP